MANQYDGGPAFPVPPNEFKQQDTGWEDYPTGMTLRDCFAMRAMQSLIAKLPLFDAKGEHGVASSRDANGQICADVSESAFKYADAMLEARKH